ncbi:MAG: glycerol-3-phosphate acyltransferase [Anaerolineales bacterium]|nr:MAG: glycerol-3-phosphate acyltransferase [Anaerolineales bacterium]
MSNTIIAGLAALLGYLLGSISFARVVTRIAAPGTNIEDLRVEISGTDESIPVGIAGGNAAAMLLGPRWGLSVAVLDMLKVVLPMLAFKELYPDENHLFIVATMGLVGHNWPIYYRFRGGRGFAVIFGSFLVLDWAGTLLSLLLGLAFGMLIVGSPMVAYISWLWWLVAWLAWRGTPQELYFALAVNLIFLLAVIPEMRLMLKMRRAGIYQAYIEGLYTSSPRWRGMKKMTERLWLLRPFFDRRGPKS